jgi:von Willebrand factor type A domain
MESSGSGGATGAGGDLVSGSGGADSAGAPGSSAGSAGQGGSDGFKPTCMTLDIGFEKLTPTVTVLVDQSNSMDKPFPDSSSDNTRWVVLRDALLSVLKPLESVVRFGLTLYTSKVGFQGGSCPILTKVPAALNNFDAISAKFMKSNPSGDTPTGESLAAVASELLAAGEAGPKFVLLATDGEPDTCAAPNPQTGQEVVVKAAQDAFKNGIRTFVIGVSSEVSDAHLQDVANAGAGVSGGITVDPDGGIAAAEQNAVFYHPADGEALTQAIQAIIDRLRTCVFHLGNTVDIQSASSGVVVLDGQVLGYQNPDGWRLNGDTELEVLGKACDRIKTDAKEIQISFPCSAVID